MMSANPFYLKGGRGSPCCNTPGTLSNTAHHSLLFFNGSDISECPDSSEHGSTTDSETSSPRYLELETVNHGSSTPESVSPMGSLDDYDCKMLTEDSFSLLGFSNPLPVLKPSTSLLEMSIASLPCESLLKGALVRIREQMAQCLKTLTELEEKARNVPTLQVRISVLQEEKRQLLKQLHSQSSKKQRSRSAGRMEYSVHCRNGPRSDVRMEDDEYSVTKKGHKVKLNSIGVGDSSVYTDPVFTDEVVNIGDKTPGHKSNRPSMKTVYVQTKNIGNAEQSKPGARSRSIGVGTMKSFTKDVSTGEGPAVLCFNHKAVQTNTVTRDTSHDPLYLPMTDTAVNTVPQVKSTYIDPNLLVTTSNECGNAATVVDPSVNVGIPAIPEEFMVATDIAICTVDDELCAKCVSRQTLPANMKEVDPIVDNRVDLRSCNSLELSTSKKPLSTSVGNSAFSLNNLVCYRCDSLDKESNIRETCQHISNNSRVGNFGAEEVKTVSVIENGTIYNGDGIVNVVSNDLAKCSSISSYPGFKTMRNVGVGNCCVTDSFCIKCDHVKTRSIGVGSSDILDLLCDRCNKRKTQSVGTSTDHKAGVKSVAVGDCCLTDNYCDRCLHVRTNTVGVGDCCLTDSFCNHSQTQSVQVGDSAIDSDSEQSISPEAESDHEDTYCGQRYSDASVNVNFDGRAQDGTDFHESDMWDGDLSVMIGDIDSDASNQDESTSEPTNQAFVISDEVVEACALLNGHLHKHGEMNEEQMINCVSTVEKNWITFVSSPDCIPDAVRCLLKLLTDQIPMLLETMINLADSNENNALHYAVSFENWEIVDALLQTGLVAVDLPNKVGYSSVMLAALTEVRQDADIPIIKKLLEAGDCDKQVQETGQTPLMLAAARGRVNMLDLLLEAGVEINAVDDDGSTALMCACEHGYIDIVKRLLAHSDCNSGLEDHEGSSALSIAMNRKYKDIALLIYGHMKLDPAGRPL